MKRMINFLCLGLITFGVMACAHNKPSPIVSVNDLFQMSKESVNFPLSDNGDVEQAISWIKSDTPTQITLKCQDDSTTCQDVEAFLQNNNLAYEKTIGSDELTLEYQRVEARKCVSGLGCTLAQNHIHMVTNHEQFLSPSLSGAQDASSAVNAYHSIYSQE